MPRECVLCTEADNEEQPLLGLPCFNHWVCRDCIPDYFVNATNNESLYPPSCCEEPLSLDRFADHVPEHVQHAFLLKEQGEYTILPKYRVYCANPPCGKFLHPSGHIKDDDSDNFYAVCDDYKCLCATCCACKTLLADGVQGHICHIQDHDQKFKEAVEENGYKECFTCGATVELSEACNHITCGCGTEFCYICGKEWLGIHSCPHYGPAIYDEDGFNQNGFHRDSGLNREGRTHHEEMIHQHAQDPHDNDDDVDNDEVDNDQENDDRDERDPNVEAVWQQLMTRLDPDQRAVLEHLDPETREEALVQIMDEWLAQGIIFDVLQPIHQLQPPPDVNVDADTDADADADGNDDDNNDGSEGEGDGDGDAGGDNGNGNGNGDGDGDEHMYKDDDGQDTALQQTEDAEEDDDGHSTTENDGDFHDQDDGEFLGHDENTQGSRNGEVDITRESDLTLGAYIHDDMEGLSTTHSKATTNEEHPQLPSVIDAYHESDQEGRGRENSVSWSAI